MWDKRAKAGQRETYSGVAGERGQERPDAHFRDVEARDVSASAVAADEVAAETSMTVSKLTDNVDADGKNITGGGTYEAEVVQGATGTFGDGTNYAEFEADGTLALHGTATYWRDIDFPILPDVAGGPPSAVLNTPLTGPQWAVGNIYQCPSQEMVHEWKEESVVTWHVHVITAPTHADAGDKYIAFRVRHAWYAPSATGSAVNTTTSPDLLIPGGTAALRHLRFDLGTVTPSGITVESHVMASLERVEATGGAGVRPSVDPFCVAFQLHVECDTLGSRTITAK